MAEYGLIGEDIQTLQEQLQSFRGTFSEEEYEEVSEKIEEIKRKSLELPSRSPIETAEILRKIVDLEMDTFSKEVTEENAKDVKRVAFLKQLRYISIYTKRGIDTEKVIKTAEEYWGTIKEYYDDIEQRSVEQEIDEIKLEATLNGIKNSKKIDMSEINLDQNYYLIRQRLQKLSKDENTREEDKLLIESLLGESTDIKSGKIDMNVMKQQLKNPKLWSLLSGVEEDLEEGKKHVSEQKELKGESDERKKEIEEICTKYGVDEAKVREILDSGKSVCIVEKTKGLLKKRFDGYEISELGYFTEGSKVRACIYNNDIRVLQSWKDIEYDYNKEEAARTTGFHPEMIVLPDNLLQIENCEFAFNRKLKSIRLPKGLRAIGKYAFESCGLESIVIPDSVIEIGYSAFYDNCLANLTLGRGIEIISSNAFANNNLTSLEVPGNVKVLQGCPDWDVDKRGAFNNNPLETLILHEGLEKIEKYAFCDTKLTEINLPSTVKEVGSEIANKYTIVKTFEPQIIEKGENKEPDNSVKEDRSSGKDLAEENARLIKELESTKLELEKTKQEYEALKEKVEEFSKFFNDITKQPKKEREEGMDR